MAGRLLGDKGIGAVAMMLPSAKPTLVNLSDNRSEHAFVCVRVLPLW